MFLYCLQQWLLGETKVAKDGRAYLSYGGGAHYYPKGLHERLVAMVNQMHVDTPTPTDENVKCPACSGTGKWTAPNGWVGLCVRCESKGFQTPKDVARNECYDNHGPAARAAVREAQPMNDTMYVMFTAHGLKDGRIITTGERIQLRPETAKLGTGALLQKLYGANKIPSDAKFIWILQGNAPVKLLVKGNGRSWANYTSRPLPKSVQF